MKKTNIFNTGCTIMLLASFCSCQKVIKVNLNDAAAKNVIEANVTDQPGPYLVSITRSVNFDQDNVFPAVSGATVVITDQTAGLADTLKEVTPGNYQTSILKGTPGHIYSLYVNASSQVYTASSTMPQPVPLDSLYTGKSAFSGNIDIIPQYTDPIAKGNYYHFLVSRNDTASDNISIRNDDLVNGQTISQPVGAGGKLVPGENVTVSLQCIDSAIYQYYYSLAQTEDQNSATPANPLTNIKGGALGYFSAHTVSTKSIIVP